MAIGMCASVCAHVVVVVRAKWFKFLLATLVVQAYWSASFWEQNSWSKSFQDKSAVLLDYRRKFCCPSKRLQIGRKLLWGCFLMQTAI